MSEKSASTGVTGTKLMKSVVIPSLSLKSATIGVTGAKSKSVTLVSGTTSEKSASTGVTGTVVDTRRIFHHTLNIQGTGLILVHYHPFGNINPSEADIITKKIVNAGILFQICVFENLIICTGYYSFADNGQL